MPKTVIITGGTKGIGLALVENFLQDGWNVVSGARNKSQDPRNSNSQNFFYISGDTRDFNFHKQLASTALEKFGALDCYINNAGFSKWLPINEIDTKFLHEIFETNVFGYFFGSRIAADHIRNGSVINISSIAGKRGSSNNSAYVSTKFAIEGLTQSLAKELGKQRIRVNSVCPVLIETPGLTAALELEHAPAHSKKMQNFLEEFSVSQSALGRLPTTDEVAGLCLFLASEKASGITGQSINVDCGVLPG
jgi:NAD(P)-dependent dehydrogenase (short-subunit alcohol dehydrogenase family)